MRYIITSVSLILGLLLIVMGLRAAEEPAKTVKKVPVHNTTAMAGKDLYREYCAVCHGVNGKGDGPAASALKLAPPDLTRIAANNGGKFPELKVQRMISGADLQPASHGSREMPIWGNIFGHMGASSDVSSVRVYNLVKYLEGMQAP